MKGLNALLHRKILRNHSLMSWLIHLPEPIRDKILDINILPAHPHEEPVDTCEPALLVHFLSVGQHGFGECFNEKSEQFGERYHPYECNISWCELIKLSIMHETINLLGAIDTRLKRHSLHNTPKNKKHQKFTFAKILDFSEDKFNDYPKFLTEREDFLQFMYSKYETMLLSIPKICEKEHKESDEKYFISLFLEQIPIFKGLPQLIKEILLNSVRTQYYQPNAIIHNEDNHMQFMAVIFIGSVSFTHKGKKEQKIKNDVIMTQAFYDTEHPTIVAKEQTVLLTFNKSIYPLIQDKLFKDICEKSRDEIADLMKSDFFIELHLKDKKAKHFFDLLKPQFYFRGEHICDAGDLPKKFYLIFRGDVKEKNHIYIREHNKWPLPNRRWEVRAVYNSFQNSGNIQPYNFFGDEQIINALRLKSTYIANSHVILFSMDKDTFIDSLSTEDFKRLKKYRNEHVNINYGEFQKSVREKVKSVHEKKKIVHKAIDTSFANRSYFPNRKISRVQNLEKKMLTDSIYDLQSSMIET